MWIFSTDGFYSIVRKQGETHLTIRARCSGDIDRLRDQWLPRLGPTITGGGTDYPVRATCEPRDLADAVATMILDLNYANFKDRLGATLGGRHLQAAHKVWHDLHLLEDPSPAIADGDNLPPSGLKPAYGGVVMSADGTQILLREPRNHFGGYVWTFAKGRPERGDDAWSCAQREIREELGCTVRDPIPVPGWFTGDTTATRFFLCTHVADIQPPDHDETSCVRWVSWEAAASMIAQTTTRTGRERDLAVLAAAQTLHRSRRA